jgi:hypothetical protein
MWRIIWEGSAKKVCAFKKNVQKELLCNQKHEFLLFSVVFLINIDMINQDIFTLGSVKQEPILHTTFELTATTSAM